MKKCLILANGKSPRKSAITFFQKNGFDTLLCADGGADSALRLGLSPDYIIGDLDSISKEAINKFKNTSKILQYKRQNDTDVEKCLNFAIKNKFNEALSPASWSTGVHPVSKFDLATIRSAIAVTKTAFLISITAVCPNPRSSVSYTVDSISPTNGCTPPA